MDTQAINTHKGMVRKYCSSYKNRYSSPSRQTIVQPKLELTTPGDSYEREADRMADFVMRRQYTGISKEMPSAASVVHPTISRRVSGSAGVAVDTATEGGINDSRGGGQPMPEALRSQMESSFGADFSGVRLHTDSRAADLSRGIQAKAFTYGNDIYFNRGQYSPDTTAGQHLIAHELTHVVQQSGKVGRENVNVVGEETYSTKDRDPIDFKNDYCSSGHNYTPSGHVYLLLYGAGYINIDLKGKQNDQGEKHEKLARNAEDIIRNGKLSVTIGIKSNDNLEELIRKAKEVLGGEMDEKAVKAVETVIKRTKIGEKVWVQKKTLAGVNYNSEFDKDKDFVVVRPAFDSETFFCEINRFAGPGYPKIRYLGVYAHGWYDDEIDTGINLGGREKGVNNAGEIEQNNDYNQQDTFEHEGKEYVFHSNRQINVANYKRINPEAFAPNAEIYLWGCNHAGVFYKSKDGNFHRSMGVDQKLEEFIGKGVKVYGFNTTTISPMYETKDGKKHSIYSGEMRGIKQGSMEDVKNSRKNQ